MDRYNINKLKAILSTKVGEYAEALSASLAEDPELWVLTDGYLHSTLEGVSIWVAGGISLICSTSPQYRFNPLERQRIWSAYQKWKQLTK